MTRIAACLVSFLVVLVCVLRCCVAGAVHVTREQHARRRGPARASV